MVSNHIQVLIGQKIRNGPLVSTSRNGGDWGCNKQIQRPLHCIEYLALVYGLLYVWFESFPIVFEGIYGFNLGQEGPSL